MKAAASSLYVHIPFCRHICAYCDFPKLFYEQRWGKPYLGALFDELDSYRIEAGFLKTIYIGGGTPTALDDELLALLLEKVRHYLAKDGEFTLEANPETITEEKARLLARSGVSRVSLGVQSAQPRLLRLMGRAHSFAQAKEAIAMLKEAGISNINADLIYALPGESTEEVASDIEAFLSLDLPHLSCYSLILERATIFAAKGYQEAPSEVQAEQYELILARLREAGYQRYEVSNFAKKGWECRHNLVYWRDEPYIGAGLGAAGYLGGRRHKNSLNFHAYCAGKFRGEEEEVDAASDLHYFLLCNLRLAEGFPLAAFKKRFGYALEEVKAEAIAKLAQRGLLVDDGDALRCTDEGLLLLDTVLLELF